MYETFYALRERPFDLVPNPRFLFLTSRQREALANLRYGLSTPRGLTVLLGEAGTGKTTLIQAALAELRGAPVKVVLLNNPTLTRAEFYEFLAKAFGLPEDAGVSKSRSLFALRRVLDERHAAGLVSNLMVDEAQSIPYELLEEIRLLSNIETTTAKLLNVTLAGQPELATRLNEPSLRQLKQRISLRCELSGMDLSETASYIAGRLRIAGGRPEQIFTRDAVEAVFEASRGIARIVNVVCDNALIGGFAAQVRPIPAAVVEEVRRDFDLDAARPAEARREAGAAGGAEGEAPPGDDDHHDPDAAQTGVPGAPLFGVFERKRRFSFF